MKQTYKPIGSYVHRIPNLRTPDTELSDAKTARTYKHIDALDTSWHYTGPETELTIYRSGHCFISIGNATFIVPRWNTLDALLTNEWVRIDRITKRRILSTREEYN